MSSMFICCHADACKDGNAGCPPRTIKDPCPHWDPHPEREIGGCSHMDCGDRLRDLGALAAACCLPIVEEVTCSGASACKYDCPHGKPHAIYEQCLIPCPDAVKLKITGCGCKPTGKEQIQGLPNNK
jgi:hypothetical protein